MLYPDFKELASFKDRKSHLSLMSSRAVKSTIPGDHHSPFRGQGLEFDTVREYVPGDDVRNIDWRVTARSGSPHLKEFKEERERSVIICVDMNETMRFGTRNTFKSVQAARVAALLGWRGLANHDRVGACLFGDIPGGLQYFAPQRTRQSHWALLKELAKPPIEFHHITLEEFLKHMTKAAHTGSLIFIISDFMELNTRLESFLSRLNKRCDVVFIAINDPADKRFPPAGALAFSNLGNKLFVNTDSIAGRTAYEDQWKENRTKLQATCSRLKIATIFLSTESDVHRELHLGLKHLSKKRKQ